MVSKEIVIARYLEEVDWVLDSPYPVTVINHGDKIDIDDDNVDIINTSNVGREAHCWLHHIVGNYDDLADWTIFSQADPHMRIEQFWKRIDLPFEDTTPLVLEYLPYFPDQEVKDKDRVEYLGGQQIRWGNAKFHGNRTPEKNTRWLTSIWRNLFQCPPPDPWWFGYAASYAVPRHRITDRPIEFWNWLFHIVETQGTVAEQTPMSAYGFELAWNYLWGDAVQYPVREIPRGDLQFPGLLEQVGNFAVAKYKHVKAGSPIADSETKQLRRSICMACPLRLDDRCSKCGCPIDHKTAWETETCPDGRW